MQQLRERPLAGAKGSAPLPAEIVSLILRNFRGTSVSTKQALLACRLVNREWGQLGWTRFWYSVKAISGICAELRFLHPLALETLNGVQLRKLAIASHPCRRIDVLLRAPMMSGIRILDYCSENSLISTAQLFVIFRTLPLLVSLHIGVGNGPVEWGDTEDQNRQDGETDQEDWVWKIGFGKLKALSIWVFGGPVRGFDLLDVMAANLGANLEYINLRENRGEQTLRFFFGQVAQNCPNLKGCRFYSDSPHPFPHSTRLLSQLVHLEMKGVSDDLIRSVATTCVHMKYLAILYPAAAQESFRHLARGPFLQALSVIARVPPDTKYDNRFALFLKERGKSLKFLESDIGETDQTLGMIQDFCPELRELRVRYDRDRAVSENAIVAFLEGSRKLQRMTLPDCIRSEAISHVAEEQNVDIHTICEFPSYADLREESWMGW